MARHDDVTSGHRYRSTNRAQQCPLYGGSVSDVSHNGNMLPLSGPLLMGWESLLKIK